LDVQATEDSPVPDDYIHKHSFMLVSQFPRVEHPASEQKIGAIEAWQPRASLFVESL
jgi:hypothetical protein